MAPSIAQEPQQAAPAPAMKGPSDYKEAYGVAGGPSRFNAEAEINGTTTQPKAKYPNYLPTWDFSKTSVRPTEEATKPLTGT